MAKVDTNNRPFKYMWLDIVRRWKHQSDIGKYKAFGGAIVHFLHGKAVTCYPSLPKIAAECGMSERTTSTAADAFEAASLIARGSGGGNSNSSDYCLLLPCNCLQGLDRDTLQAYDRYLAKVINEPCKIDQDTLQLFARELKNHLRTIDNQSDSKNAVLEDMDINKERTSKESPSLDTDSANVNDRETALNPETPNPAAMEDARARVPVTAVARIELPTATAAQRNAWDGAWPDDGHMIKQVDNKAHHFIIYDCLRVMGYRWTDDDTSDIRMPAGSATKFRDAWLRDRLPGDVLDELAARKMAGTLKAVDVANVLAAINLTPKPTPTDGRDLSSRPSGKTSAIRKAG